ncbi:MAG: hypothetical protein JXJ19_03410 [Elusimicrobia bacterium]|nr:hypothetical protein [Elusimicrobiota bacterium]
MNGIWPVIIAGFALRLWPQFAGIYSDSDVWFHLWWSGEIKNNGFRVPKANNQFILGGRTCYPPLLHYLVALIPGTFRKTGAKIISPLFDMSVMVFFFILYGKSLWLTDSTGFYCAVLLYSFSPLLLKFQANSVYTLKARTMGRFFLTGSLVCFYLYVQAGGLLYLAGASLFFCLVLLSSKFTLQTYAVITAFMLAFSVKILLVLFLGFLLALAFSGGFYISVLRQHIEHQKMYFRKVKYYSAPSWMNNTEDIRYILNPVNIFRNPAGYFDKILYRITFTGAVFYMPVFAYFILRLASGAVVLGPGAGSFLVLWTGACLFAFLATSFKALISLGQADRYLEYCVFPAVIIMMNSSFKGTLYENRIFVVIVLLAFYLATNFKHIYVNIKKRKIPDDDYDRLERFLAGSDPLRILFIPMKTALRFAHIHKHMFLWASPFVEPYVKPGFWDDTFKKGRFLFPSSIGSLRDKYSIDCAILDSAYVEEYTSDLERSGFGFREAIGRYSVFGLQKKGDTA